MLPAATEPNPLEVGDQNSSMPNAGHRVRNAPHRQKTQLKNPAQDESAQQ